MKKTLFVLLLAVLFATFALAETVITLAAGAVGQELELAKDAAAKYMEMHPDVTVKVLETPDLSTDRLDSICNSLKHKVLKLMFT